jgi:DNA polymerase
MFIGEAPGDDEAQINRPFVGRAGQRLRKELKKHACFSPDTTLISNLLPCRPLNNQFPSGKAGGFWINESCSGQQRQVNAADLITNCAARWIEKEIELVEPKILVTMGNPALQYVRGQKGITKHRGVWVFVPEYGLWSFAIYHPSYVIRSEGAGVGGDVPQHFTDDVAKIASEWEGILDNKIV